MDTLIFEHPNLFSVVNMTNKDSQSHSLLKIKSKIIEQNRVNYINSHLNVIKY